MFPVGRRTARPLRPEASGPPPSEVPVPDGRRLRLTADLELELRAADARWWPVLERRYGSFLQPAAGPSEWDASRDAPPHAGSSAGSTWTVELGRAGDRPPDPADLPALSAAPVRAHSTLEGLRLSHPGFTVEVDRRRRRVEAGGILHRLPLDACLRHLLAERPETLVVHAALLADRTGARIAAGASGSGKSTLASLHPDRARCDELAIVVRRPGGWWGASTPFWRARPWSGPLRALFLLEHGERTRAEPLAPTVAFRQLAGQVVWPDWSPELQARSFGLLASLVEDVPVFRFPFRPDPDVWELLEGAA